MSNARYCGCLVGVARCAWHAFMHFMFPCQAFFRFFPEKLEFNSIFSRLPLYKVEHHPAVELWIDRFERTKGELIIMKADEFRNRSVNQIANVCLLYMSSPEKLWVDGVMSMPMSMLRNHISSLSICALT